MDRNKVVLVTGSAGRIGQAVVHELAGRGHLVRGFDRVPSAGVAQDVVGTLARFQDVARAMEGVETLVHLAATPDDADFLTELLPNNIVGVYHVFEAARLAGVKRMILASSGQVVWHSRLTGPLPLGADATLTPRYWYAAGKVFLEAAGRAFAETHGMSVLVIRLGWCPRTAEQVREIPTHEWGPDVYLSPGDAGRFFACAVEATAAIPFSIFYATSIPAKVVRYDLEPARTLLGFEPRDIWPQGVAEMGQSAAQGALPPRG
jgi:uronate dehydrogenase